jgi:hypothetical protein
MDRKGSLREYLYPEYHPMIRSTLKKIFDNHPPLTQSQSWAIAASGLLTVINDGRHDILASTPQIPFLWQKMLKQWWSIENREGALECIRSLMAEGHRVSMAEELGHEPLAWDLGRAINIARWAYSSKYFSEAETWDIIFALARPLQEHYQSWAELGADYVAGHDIWNGGPGEDVDQALQKLTDSENEKSPWNTIPWNTPLEPIAESIL